MLGVHVQWQHLQRAAADLQAVDGSTQVYCRCASLQCSALALVACVVQQ
jgi:hypothetical protein